MDVFTRLRTYIAGVGSSGWEETLYSDEEQDIDAVRQDIAALGDYPVEERRPVSRLGSLLRGERVRLHTDHLDIVCSPEKARITGKMDAELTEQEEDLTAYLEATYDAGSERRER